VNIAGVLLTLACRPTGSETEQDVWSLRHYADGTTTVATAAPDVVTYSGHAELAPTGPHKLGGLPSACAINWAHLCGLSSFQWEEHAPYDGGWHPLSEPANCSAQEVPTVWPGFRLREMTTRTVEYHEALREDISKHIDAVCLQANANNAKMVDATTVYSERVTQTRLQNGSLQLRAEVRFQGEVSACVSTWPNQNVDLRFWRIGLLKALSCSAAHNTSVLSQQPDLLVDLADRLELEAALFDIVRPPETELSTTQRVEGLLYYTESMGWWTTVPTSGHWD
jgi:hypothetical protein